MKDLRFGMKTVIFFSSFLMVFTIPGFSQKDDSDTERNFFELEELTVTAEKSEEKIQDVPMAISAFSESTLEDAGVDDIRDVALMVPNLELGEYVGWGYRANFRGMNWSAFTQKLPVVMYIDHVPYDEGSAFDGDFNNIERIEVLRGAQGTLYGQNALAGIINIISKTPGPEVEGKVKLEAGQYGSYGAQASYNGPLSGENLFFGFSGSYHQKDGFMENDYPGEDTFGGGKTTRVKGRLRWLASDRLEANLGLSLYAYRNIGSVGNTISGSEYVDHAYRNPDDKREADTSQLSLDLACKLDNMTIRSITASRQTKNVYEVDYSFIYPLMGLQVNNSTISLTTQEFRFQSPDQSSGIKWLGGLFFSSETNDRDEYGTVYNTRDVYGPDYGYYYNMYNQYPASFETTSQSVFGQVTLPLGASLDFTAGLRYETVHKSMDYAYLITDADSGMVLMPETTYSVSKDWTAVLPRMVIAYSFTPSDMMYLSWSKGYLPGGFNSTEADKDQADFDAQYSTTLELGTKTGWIDNRLFFNATVFQTDITDMQVYEIPETNVYIASNAGKARSQGVELELAATPTPGLNLSAAMGWLDSKFVEYEDNDGNRVSDSPEYTANFSANYRHSSGIYVGAGYQGRGDAWADDENTVKKEGYWLANVKAGYEKKSWEVYLQVKNLTDTEYLEHIAVANEGAIVYSTVGEPRTISLVAAARF